jgi:peptidyl-prolyl cis-trans isomerase B (cyclophilin B)
MIQIEMENGRKMKLELDAEAAPVTVANFLKLVGGGFYDGLIFHRVIQGFMIQGGDPLGNGTGGSRENIKGEFAANGHNNPISHKRGVISMARAQNPNSASSQFFIMHEDGEFLDGQYAAFGRVVEGIEVVDEIASVKTNAMDRPLTEQKIKAITIIEG